MKSPARLALLTAVSLTAQQPVSAQQPATMPAQPAQTAQQETTLSVRSTLILVPALVKTKSGDLVYTLKAQDFLVTDDGVPQRLTLEEDTGDEPLALVVVVETGGEGGRRLDQYADLGAELDAVVGNVPHKVAVVGFDSTPELLQPFTTKMDKVQDALSTLEAGNDKAAILDGIAFGVNLLRKQPLQYRRAILLLSETIDHGSAISLADALRAVGDTNTAIYSIGFSSSKTGIGHEATKFSSDQPNPKGGCFAKDPNKDSTEDQSRVSQDYDCIAELLPPLRLAKMAAIAATNAMRRNVPETVAQLTGGEFYSFKDVKSLKRDLITISNHTPNRYFLSFHPQSPHPGFHTIQLKLPDYAHLTIEARNGYWIDDDATSVNAPTPPPSPAPHP